VVLLEREDALGAHSSGLNAAILRTAGGDPITTALARRGMERLYAPPEGFASVPLVDGRGLILLADEATAPGLRRAAKEARGDAVEISTERLRSLAPLFRGRGTTAFHFPREGQLEIAAMVEGFARGARRRGVDIRTGHAVHRLLSREGRVTGARLADGSEIRAATTVLAAGGWAAQLGAGSGSRVRLRPTRRHLLVTRPDRTIDPRWPVVWSLEDDFYCRPESGGMLICACDQVDVDPDHCTIDGDICELVAEKTARLLPALAETKAAHLWCGMRTLTADGRFAIGPDPDLAGLFWVAGLGGHGMVCAFEVGRIAGALLDGRVPPEAAWRDLIPARLATGVRPGDASTV
jgi:glycine/D-amino acid oxidase-like deaminating enzyme